MDYNKFDLYHIDSLKTLFIMESPHSEEIKKNIPCIGETGVRMTEKLYGASSEPLGEKIKENIDCQYGILNTFPFPLGIEEYLTEDQKIYSGLKNLKWSSGMTREQFYIKHFEVLSDTDLLEVNTNFLLRLSDIIEKAKKIESIVICGFIAQSVFCILCEKDAITYNKPIELLSKSGKKLKFIFTNHPSTKNIQWDFNMNLLQ